MTRRSLLLPGLIVALYVTWPYATLVQLRQDLRDHNVQALQQDIDWNSVRAGLKQQATESFDAPPAATKISAVVGDDLPPFGAGFAASMASKAIDRRITPQGLADAFGAQTHAGEVSQPTVESAGFNGPASFEVKLRPAQESPKDPPISIDFALVRNGWRLDWKVIHVSMPPSMMQPTKST
jgi:hypothetical protein